MSAPITPGMEGLRTDQAPPLAIPASFFAVTPVAMAASGALLAIHGDAVFSTRWSPLAAAATHLGTLGFLGAAMMGALYQMIPVVAGAPVPAPRLAHAVHAIFVAGLAALVAAFVGGEARLFAVAPALLTLALALFVAPVGVALARAPTRSATVWGMRLALAGLVALGALGVAMALARAGHARLGGDLTGFTAAHAALGGALWCGGLVTAVSWQVVPMFYLTPELPAWSRGGTIAAAALTAIATPLVLLVGGGAAAIAIATAPLAAMVWLVHPVVTLRAIAARRRRRVDGSVRFWWFGMLAAPAIPALVPLAALADSPRFAVALAWVAIWGWAGAIVHGMLTRIVPFLVWFHRYAALVGVVAVPSMRELLPDARIRVAAWLHGASVAFGLAAIATGAPLLARVTGALLLVTGATLASNLHEALRPRPTAP